MNPARVFLLCLSSSCLTAWFTWSGSTAEQRNGKPAQEVPPPQQRQPAKPAQAALRASQVPDSTPATTPLTCWLQGGQAETWLRLRGAEPGEIHAWWQTFLQQSTPGQRLALLEKLALQPHIDCPDLLRLVIGAVARENPLRAAGMVENVFHRHHEHWLLGDLGRVWAQNDPQAAFAWFQRFGDLAANPFQEELMRGWTRKDPQAVLDHLTSGSRAPASLEQHFSHIFEEVILRHGSAFLADWLQDQPADAYRASILRSGLAQLAVSDPRQAAGLLHGMPPEVRIPARTLRQIGSSLLAHDGVENALAWAAELAMPDQQQTASAAVLAAWSRQNPTEAATWMQRHPMAPGVSQGLAELAQEIHESNPQNALAWAASIPEAAQRRETVIELASQWLSKDRQAAEAWAAINLPAEDLRAAQNMMPEAIEHQSRE